MAARRWYRALAAAGTLLALAGAAPAAQAQKQAPKGRNLPQPKEIVNKDDGIPYPPDQYERFRFVRLNSFQIRKLGLWWLQPRADASGTAARAGWSRIRKSTSQENPKTYLALPLKWPIDTKNWTPEANCLRYLISTDAQLAFGIDLNGDGRFVGKSENYNKNPDGTFGPIDIRLKYKDGTVAPYSLVIADDPQDSNHYYVFRSNAVWVGYLPSKRRRKESEEVVLIDANNNGLFNDYGQDRIKVGDKRPALLSQLIVLKGRLYHLKVHPSGARVWVKPYTKPYGRLDMLKNFRAPSGARLEALFVRNQDGTYTLDVAPADFKKTRRSYPCQLPVGKWYVVGGRLVHRRGEVGRPYQGKMEPIEVKEGQTTAPEWGEPFRLEIEVSLNVTGISVDAVRVLGRAKEEYVVLGPRVGPVVEVRYKKRPVHRGLVKVIPGEDVYVPYSYEPRRRGLYQVEVLLDSKIFGELKAGPEEVAFRPFGG